MAASAAAGVAHQSQMSAVPEIPIVREYVIQHPKRESPTASQSSSLADDQSVCVDRPRQCRHSSKDQDDQQPHTRIATSPGLAGPVGLFVKLSQSFYKLCQDVSAAEQIEF